MKIIGINGYKGAGKNEVARIARKLLERDGATCLEVGFADKVKIYAAKSLGYLYLTDEQCIALMNDAKENWQIDVRARGANVMREVAQVTGRQYLQNVGSQARKLFGEDFWVNQVLPDPARFNTVAAAEANAAHKYPSVDYLIIPDLRYENEARRVRALGGVVWEVVRPGVKSDGHDSEQRLDAFHIDWQIYNDSTLAWLEGQVDEAILETLN